MEFSHIGHHCKASGCKQLDFLPFTCELCSNRYCLDHRKPESHKCNKTHLREDKKSPVCPLCSFAIKILPNEDMNNVIEEHITSGCKTRLPTKFRRCQYKKCRETYFIAVSCDRCHKNHCIKHQMSELHECTGLEGPKSVHRELIKV